jgi:hypothetical protein
MKKKATEKQHPFMKMAGIKDMNKFMEMYPTEDDFFADYPQAKYGMMLADGGFNLPGGSFGSQGKDQGLYGQQGLSAQGAMAGLNAAGPMGPQGQYGPVMDTTPTSDPSPEQEEQAIAKQQVTPQQPAKKQRTKYKFNLSDGDKTWNPFKNDNTWNTGEGLRTTDTLAAGVAIGAGALPFTPRKGNNPKPNIVTGNYGTGSHAAFADGGELSDAKAREMLHNPPHGKNLTEKQRRYFGAVASGYADDGATMAIGQLNQMQQKLDELSQVITPDSKLEPWIASKVTLASDYLNNVGNYMQFNPEAKQQGQQQQMQQMQAPMYMGGYMAESGINIDPSKRGTFTAAATKHGESVQGFASQVLANKENYSPAMVKKANFARNAAKWKKADGGKINLNLPEKQQEEGQSIKMGGFGFAEDNNFMVGVKPTYQTDRLTVSPYVTGGINQNFQKIPADYGIEGSYQLNNKFNLNGNIGKSKRELGLTYNFADGGPMITHVKPSPHTYFELMTRQGRQVPETPNFMAADGMSMPVTDADRQAYNNYVLGMKKLPGYDNVNWQHDQTFQKQAAQQLGFDYSKTAAIQADMQARNQSIPGSIKGVQAGDTWGGDPTWVGDRERQKEYKKYQYIARRENPQTHVMEEYYNSGTPQFTPKTNEEYLSEVEKARGNFNGQQDTSTNNLMNPAYFAQSTPEATPRATGLAATGFPTRDEALGIYKARKASGQELPSNYFEEDGRKQRKEKMHKFDQSAADPIGMARLTGEDTYAYGGPILGGFDARLNQNYPYPMTNQYPHKIGGQYHPYDHTMMEHGGMVPVGANGLQVEGNQFKYLSPKTVEILGKKHSDVDKNGKGGTDIAYNGNVVEAERGETFHVDDNGMMSGRNMAEDGTTGPGIVGGNLVVPGTKTKFKDAFKDVAKGERKAGKIQDKASYFLNEYGQVDDGPKNKYSSPAFNYGKVMADAYQQKTAQNEAVKKQLTDTQNKMLELGGMIDPENGAKKVSEMFKGTAKWGKKMVAKDGINDLGQPMQGPQPSGTTQAMWSTPGTQSFDRENSQAQTNLGEFADWARNSSAPSSTAMSQKNIEDVTDWAMANPGPSSTEKEKKKEKTKTLRNKYYPDPSALADAFEQADSYPSQQLQPYFGTYSNISLQNQKNAIQSAFGPALKGAKTPAQQAAISAQMAEQLANVDAQEFQINQQGRAGLQQDTLNEQRRVQSGNISLDQAALEKTLGAKEAARQIRRSGMSKLKSDAKDVAAENRKLGMYEQYGGWQQDPNGNWHMIRPAGMIDEAIVRTIDPNKKETTKSSEETNSKTRNTKKKKETKQEEDYYGGKLAYFGIDMPASIQRTYFGGGAVGGGGMAMGAGQSMQGLPGQAGFMASRYTPGGNGQNKKKKKRTT